MNTKPLICCICKQQIKPNWHGWAGGNNAEPIDRGRCCDDCDKRYVIPARLVEIYRQKRGE